MTEWKQAQEYVELAFSIDRYFPDYVDAYFGPPQIKTDLLAQPKPTLPELSSRVERIFNSTDEDETLPDERKDFLLAQLTAMQTMIQILGGKEISVVEEMQHFFGLTPSWVKEDVFDNIHNQLDTLLPGKGSLPERMQDFREATAIPNEKLLSFIRQISSELQRLTHEFVPMPEKEGCEYVLVNDKPWKGYNWYQGSYQSRVEFNTDLPTFLSALPMFIAHEAYPGHHTDNVMKEKELFQGKGYLEASINLLNTPASVLAEGIGENALNAVASPEQIIDFFQFMLDELHISEFDGAGIYQLTKTWKQVDLLNINLVLMLHDREAPDHEVIDYQLQYGLSSKEHALKSLEFLKNPMFRSYACLYPLGYQLVDDYLTNGANRKKRFLHLLQNQVLPSQLGV